MEKQTTPTMGQANPNTSNLPTVVKQPQKKDGFFTRLGDYFFNASNLTGIARNVNELNGDNGVSKQVQLGIVNWLRALDNRVKELEEERDFAEEQFKIYQDTTLPHKTKSKRGRPKGVKNSKTKKGK